VLLYVDGVLNATGSITPGSGILDSSNFVSIGSRQGGTTTYNNQFIGRMEEVAIYKVALNAAQVQSHYQSVTNRAPIFASNPFSKPDANADETYTGTIAGSATDPNGDAVLFTKVSGPAWLNVAANGGLSGVPANGDAGGNSFVVRATDSHSLSSLATLNISVIAPLVVSMSFEGANLYLNWSGGIPPFQVQQTTNLTAGPWEDLGDPITGNSLDVVTTNSAIFYRIKGQTN
jgi:hypothetical protein